jgi:hypothetical protein
MSEDRDVKLSYSRRTANGRLRVIEDGAFGMEVMKNTTSA